MENRGEMIELLTGVQSSRRTYYAELKKTVNELQKKNIQLEIINDVMKGFNIEMTMDDMLKNVMEKLKTIFPLERISIALGNDKELTLSNVYPQHLFHMMLGLPLPKEESLYWHVFHSGKPYVFITNSTQNERVWVEEESFRKLGLVSIFLFPLTIKGTVTGILTLGSKEMMGDCAADLAFFQQLSDQLAVCIENTRLYNEVLKTKKQWEETFLSVSDAIFIADLHGSILQANEAAKKYFPKEEKQKHLNVEHLLFKQAIASFKKALSTSETSGGELHFAEKTCEWYSFPILDTSNELHATIFYIKDVTAKRKMEAQLVHSGKLAAIGEMAAGVAHELNNPLTAIMGNAQLLLRKQHFDDKLLEGIYECGKRSKNIIRNLLTFSRQEEFFFEKFSVNEAILLALSLVGNQIQKQAIDIETKLDESLPLIEGSCQQIGQIILNLLLNAKDALEDCGRSNKKIVIQTSIEKINGADAIAVMVQDNGSGIKEAVLTEIFHPFFTTKNAATGTGLGLSVSLGIAEAHGGTLKADSVFGKGSTFKLILPV
ncbi:GAF domain-containing sensor histidine kinase [Heyndrickxia ginsengihumi]|uniref:GAF domain-containing sensor histidine kinase n=1 Tax=Heyndrickxia ginsengihumi TaxID=363870 RepID=UPI00203CF181|nr:GAF domain-containing sensor histidine kinase [Heyndrickxia ginsengihumi]MCM3022616.1 ATP-binding protein [Heyndrickxia ginsengihumi]